MSKFGKFDSNKLQQYAQAVGNVNLEQNRKENIHPYAKRCVLFFPVNIGMDLHITTGSLEQMQF